MNLLDPCICRLFSKKGREGRQGIAEPEKHSKREWIFLKIKFSTIFASHFRKEIVGEVAQLVRAHDS